ncbi:MAG: aminodeoxychorismate/anthranilate synthase component II [Lachnospiraceae bacterium]|nr:aminodeoxychorismate/anthranilate synthase component II [Lachnospiraceae bacterium]
MYYMVDNYDSFVYNLSAYLRELGQKVLVRRADEVTLSEINALKPEGILLSPGPRRPEDAAESRRVLQEFQNKIPILGVCLGHQVIGQAFGASVCKGKRPMHGKISKLYHDGTGVFSGLPESFSVTRYHSLIVSGEELPPVLRVNARTADGVIMGLEHREFPVYGVQFHPEAVLTEYGRELLMNFHKICERWRAEHAIDTGV